MNVFEAIQKRRSVRTYSVKQVSKKTLERILEAARLAPSAGNVQPWHFIVVKDPAKREALAEGGRYARFMKESPVVIVGCGDAEASPNWYKVDVAIAMQNMVLAATQEDLGTCWIGSFSESQIRKLLEIPENFKVVALLSVGYPRQKTDNASSKRERKKLGEMASFEEYGNHA
jgi:nitroreductase